MSHRDFMSAFVSSGGQVDEKICTAFKLSPDGEEMNRLRWSGLFSDEKIGLTSGTPAQVLEHILNKRWKLKSGDKDFIVMWHRFRYEAKGISKEIQAYLTATGDNEINTAMAKTVGLPLAIAAKLLMQDKIKSRGVVIPVVKEIYDPVLNELGELGIRLKEMEV
jgi:saccharopine dehydrogenase (NADP+, L-glutamate forming)